jgi:hypothetical protein
LIRRLLLIALLALPGSAIAAEASQAVPEAPEAVAVPDAPKAVAVPEVPGAVPEAPEAVREGSQAVPEAPVSPSVGATKGIPGVEGRSEPEQSATSASPDTAPQAAASPSPDAGRLPVTSEAAGEPSPSKIDEALPSRPGEPKPVDDSLARYRTPFETLSERMIGEASRSIRFDWRRKAAAVGVLGSQLLELNNFYSWRLGGFARTPLSSSLMSELAVNWVSTRGSDSTKKLALTPYRQSGRPSRLEVDLNFGFPLAEGVVTAWPGFFPATEMVFSLDAGFRYLYYPGELYGASFLDIAKAAFQPTLTDMEKTNLEKNRLPGMQVDPGRYNLLAGFSTDLYFQSGGFISPRVMLALPIFSGLNESGLQWWWELSLGLGWMF